MTPISVCIKVLYFPWCDDFSWARSFSISHASHDRVLILDCDEVVKDIDFTGIQNAIEAYPYAIGQYEEARKFYLKAGNFPMSQERLANLPITTQNDIT